jgi:putative membrane protein
MKIESYFNKNDLERIKETIKEVEAKTGGEVVPYFSFYSGEYEYVHWIAGLSFSLITTLFTSYTLADYSNYFEIDLIEYILPIVSILSLIVGYHIVKILRFKKFLIPPKILKRNTERAAKLAFLQEEVFNTKDRIGILIYISMFEKQIHIIGDSGIHSKIKQDDWKMLIKVISDGFSNKVPVVGIVDAINKCGDLLIENGFVNKGKPNELKDDLRINTNE